MIRLFASDLDGTLLNKDHQMDDYIRKGISLIEKHGGQVAACTGRNAPMCHLAGLDGLKLIICNGAAAVDDQGKVLFTHEIDPALLEEMYDAFKACGPNFQTVDHCYVPHSRATEIEHQKKKNMDRHSSFDEKGPWLDQYVFDCDLETIKNAGIIKVNIPNHHDENSAKIEAFIEAHKDQLINRPSDVWIYEFTSADVNKASGIREFAKVYGIQPDQIAVYGDGGNDLEMLKAFEHSYAPADGHEPAKRAASKIIGNAADYSVIDHMVETALHQKTS